MYCIIVRWQRLGHSNVYRKFHEVWTCGCWDMRANRHTDTLKYFAPLLGAIMNLIIPTSYEYLVGLKAISYSLASPCNVMGARRQVQGARRGCTSKSEWKQFLHRHRSNQYRTSSWLSTRNRTSSSAIAEGPRDALSQLKSCQLLHNCTKNHIWLEWLPFHVV